MFQQKTFGNTRRHGPFARSRRPHNNHTEDLVKRHHCTVLLFRFLTPGCFFKVRGRKSFLDAQLDQVPLSYPRSVQRCTTWGWLVQPVDAHQAFTSLPSVLQKDKRGRGGAKEERRRRGGMLQCRSQQRWVDSELNKASFSNSSRFTFCFYCITGLCNCSKAD